MRFSIFSLVVLMMIFFTSCEKNDLFDEEVKLDLRDGDEADRKGCFDFVYPISLVMPDGTILTGDKEELRDALKNWYEQHPDVIRKRNKPQLQFPVDLIFEHLDAVKTINNREQMKRVYEFCRGENNNGDWGNGIDKNRKRCFKFIYPITFTMPDGSFIIILDGDQMRTFRRQWFGDNSVSAVKPKMNFPIQIKFRDSDELVTLNSQEELRQAFRKCKELYSDGGMRRCFKFIYPLTYLMPDGSEISGDSREEIKQAVRAWFEAHPDVPRKRPALKFPVKILFEDSDQIITLNSKEDLRAAFERCKELAGDGGDDGTGDQWDCPELQANVGDDCILDNGQQGTVNEECKCEV